MRRLRGPNCLYQKQCNNCNFITDQGRAGDLSRSSHVWKCRREVKVTSYVQLFATPCAIQFMELSRPENWSWVAFPFSRGSFQPRDWTQVSPHCRWILYQLSHKESPRILEWVAYPFSSRSSQPRNRTGVSCITGGFFTNWAMREAKM